MDYALHNGIVNFIWGIADDVLRDVYVRGKYRDVILPMTVIRRVDGVLEETKDAVLKMKEQLDRASISNQDAALCQASGQSFYNTSPFTLRDLKARAKQQQLKADFEAYLDGFSPNVQEILDKFKFRNQIPTLVEADILGHLIEKFVNPSINLSPKPVYDSDGNEKLPALDNHAMGTIFEELIRRFNEENNEEAGEHFTPRDVVRLMAELVFLPIANQVESGTYLVYDGACGTGGMLTVAEQRLSELAVAHGKDVSIHLYGQEINPETFAISKADLLLKGEGTEADNLVYGSTLSTDGFPAREFDFMLSNPPYGKSWKTDLERMGGKRDLSDPRFVIEHTGDPEFSLVTRSNDGQLMFLVNKLSKMKQSTKLGSRIAEVHNGSSLFTGDAGQGESNIRRWIIENDWLEAIVALPLNMFYNTGIATYIWVLTNRKPGHRKGKVQLIDATQWFRPRRKNLGKKNCEMSEEDIQRICETSLAFKETEQSKIFDNAAFGYWKITVERPLRLRSQFTKKAVEGLRYASGDDGVRRDIFMEFGQEIYRDLPGIRQQVLEFLKGDADEEDQKSSKHNLTDKKKEKLLKPQTWARDVKLLEAARELHTVLGDEYFPDHNEFRSRFDAELKNIGLKLTAAEKKIIQRAVSWTEAEAPPVVKKVYKPGTAEADALLGRYEVDIHGKTSIVTYEPDTQLRDTEQVPLLQDGGIESFFRCEVLPYVFDAWIDDSKTKIGYEISFTRYFYKPQPMRGLEEIRADILALGKETEGLLDGIVGRRQTSG
ncbi:MAG: class I SAM-dependent DNA methyltransferase [Thermodesulfobacteriota bacterium]|nr:class I SAM-dependent DNA methyltransferase [Thermodesulfobacteriota bacterium]